MLAAGCKSDAEGATVLQTLPSVAPSLARCPRSATICIVYARPYVQVVLDVAQRVHPLCEPLEVRLSLDDYTYLFSEVRCALYVFLVCVCV